MMILTTEEMGVIKTLIPTKNYKNAKIVFDTIDNRIISTDGFIAIEMCFDKYRDNARILSAMLPGTFEANLFRLKDLEYLQTVTLKHYDETHMKDGQLMPIPVDVRYFHGSDTILTDDARILEEMGSIQSMIKVIHEKEEGLFQDARPEMFVSKAKIKFDRVLEKIDKSQAYTVGPEFIMSQSCLGIDCNITVMMKTPIRK